MCAMLKRRRSRSLVSLLAVLALLVCQAAAVTQARPLQTVDGIDASVGCHPVGSHEGDSGKTSHTPCDSAQTVGDYLKIQAAGAAVLPPSLAINAPMAALACTRAPPVALAGAPPPLRLLHCRLRN
ncbi:MAG: hypothetical protein ACXW2I_14435 [Burkholderiales bacterium]